MQTRGVATCLLLLAVLLLAEFAAATYRKPPFNGSIFGKRGNAADYDGAGKALSAMCEIASEACSAWFPQADNN
ncbi:neuropeptide SIFamide [Periplaneta americana]|uniref:neuropeptide SIFamide n=1 Tax=Periplaneta americana TaxID=6978 RepID=UPI0037E8D593